MEQNEREQAEEKEEVNLGRIQYKLDYDFQQGQVVKFLRNFTIFPCRFFANFLTKIFKNFLELPARKGGKIMKLKKLF